MLCCSRRIATKHGKINGLPIQPAANISIARENVPAGQALGMTGKGLLYDLMKHLRADATPLIKSGPSWWAL
jgi:hypothetical protein